jgi:subtilisin family serine protease
MVRSQVRHLYLHLTLLAVALVSVLLAVQPVAAAPPPRGPAGEAKAGSIIVRLKPGADTLDLGVTLASAGARVDRSLGRRGAVRLELPPGADAAAFLAALRANPAVAEAGLDFVARAFNVPNDPGYPDQWDLQSGAGGINAEGAWDLSPARGAGVIVAVIDTGVAYEDFTGGQALFGPKQFKRAPDFAGVPIVAPWDWIDGDSHAGDENGHGTHVASTIAEATDNGLAEAGVSAASIMPLRILDFAGGGSASDLIDSIYYATDHGAKVINMSLGFSGTGSPDANGDVCTEIVGLADALEYANAYGVTVVAASGNDGVGTVACPAAYPTVIAVGATDYNGSVTWYSNSGAALAVAAPGGDPNADLNGDGAPDDIVQQSYCLDPVSLFLTGQYTDFCDMPNAGTSMASPHVAGTAALLIGQLATLAPSQVRDLLLATARDRGAPGWDAQYGAGIIDAAAAMASVIANPPPVLPPPPPPPPPPVPQPGATNVAAAPLSATSIRVTWTDNATGESGFRIDRSTDGGTTWAQAGTLSANATGFTNYGLAAGTAYSYRVRSYDSLGNSPWSNIATATTFPPPSAPTSVAATPLSATSIKVTWVDTSSTESGFKIERSLDGVTFNAASYVGANATSVTVNSLTPATTYWFRVRAYDGTVYGDASNTVQATTFALPSAPANLVATPASTTSIALSWTDTSTTEQGFKVERSADGGGSWSVAGTLGANIVAWTNTGLTPSTTYSYRVRGYEGSLLGEPSNVATATTLAPPSPPANLVASAVSTTSIRLDWVDTSTYEQGFKVERSADDGISWTQVALLGVNASTYTATSLAPATRYSFRVRAYQGAVNGDYSAIAVATTMDPPSPPANVTAQALSPSSIKLTWTNSSPIQTSVKIERSLDAASWTQVASVSATTTTWTNSSLLPGTEYFYRLRATAGTTNGPYTGTVAATTLDAPTPPAAVTAETLSPSSIKLTWTNTSAIQTYVKIERSFDGNNWAQVAVVSATTTTWTNSSLLPSTQYFYRLRATAGTTDGPYSGAVAATTLDAPSPPVNVTATALTATSVKLTWTDTCSYESGFKVERSLDGVTWTQVAVLVANSTSWTNYSLTSKTTYYYRVRAYQSVTNGGYSAVVSVTTP